VEQIGALAVRMALHTGAAQERGGDYFGPPLNRVARLMSAAHGGQVLLSLPTQELVRDQLPAETTLRDLGEHRLKDLFRPERIFQLSAPELPSEFPPLRTLDAFRNNLPLQPTLLIGREKEVAEVCERLSRPEVRLLTLTGAGGTGKTRLGLQAAAELTQEFEDGVFFVSLAAISDPELVVGAVAETLGVKEVGGQPSILPGASTPEDANVGKGSAGNRPQVSGSRSPQERPTWIGCSRLTSVLVAWRRLLGGGWLMETTTGFAFFRRCPRLLAAGG
jgi:hypothetical protein